MVYVNQSETNTIKKNELRNWIVNEVTTSIQRLASDDKNEQALDAWARAFDGERAAFLVDAEFVNDWGYDERTEIPVCEAREYARDIMLQILDSWYLSICSRS